LPESTRLVSQESVQDINYNIVMAEKKKEKKLIGREWLNK
jgi:hypothetical protein